MKNENNYNVIRLIDFIATDAGLEQFNSVASSFLSKDNDIETFLKKKAVQSIKLGTSATYLIVSRNKDFSINILGYFTLTSKILEINNPLLATDKKSKLNNNERKVFRNFGNQNENTKTFQLPAILLAQFGRNFNPKSPSISGTDLMTVALNVIKDVQKMLGGKIVFLECLKIHAILDFYKNLGFKPLDTVNFSQKKKDFVTLYIIL